MTAALLLGSVALLLAGHLFRLLRWEQFIRIYERPMRGVMLRGMAVGYGVNFLLPFHIGDVFRAWFTGRRMKNGVGFALATVIMDRFLDVWVVALLFGAFRLAGVPGVRDDALYYLVFAVVLAAALAVVIALRGPIKRFCLAVCGIFNDAIKLDGLEFCWSLINTFKDLRRVQIGRLALNTGLMWVSYLASYGVLAAALGLLVGIPALRLKGDYLAIITLGFGMIIVNIINNLPFCGQQGLGQGSASSALYATGLGFSNDEKMRYLWLVALVVILCVAAMFLFVRSKYGRAIRAIRDNEIAASASGINVNYYKVLTFTISAFFAGITGALYACCNGALTTTSFAFTNGSILNSVFIVVMVVVGGMGSLTGSVIAAVVMFLLNYTIKNGAWVAALPAIVQNVFAYPMLVYSIALIIVILLRPKGIMGSREFALCDIPRWPARIRAHFADAGAARAAKKEVSYHG